MEAEALHSLLSKLNFGAETTDAVRVRMIHNKLKPYGIILRKQQRRVNSGRKYFYTFLQTAIEQVEYQNRDYKSIKNGWPIYYL